MKHSLAVLRAEWRLLLFGFLMAFASSAGQTFFISLFSAEFRAAFELGHGGFGALYSAATLVSGFLLVWAGGLIDRIDLRIFAAVVLVGLAIAAGVAATASGPVTLLIALFLLRFFGQGLSSHTAVTATARYADPSVRGKAVSLATLGFPVGEAVWPLLAVALITAIGWRATYAGVGGATMLVLLPIALLLLLTHGQRHAEMLQRTSAGGSGTDDKIRQWTRREVARDPTFLWTLVAVMAPSFVVTGILFHQVHLVEVKGWSLASFAAGYIGYAAFQIGTALIAGLAIDRFGARRIVVIYLCPLAFGVAVLATLDALWAGYVFLALCGVTSGASGTLLGTLWAEIYGVRHLGAIRALVTACSVVASALSPATMGWALDAGVSIDAIFWACFAYVLVGMIVLARLYGWVSMDGPGAIGGPGQ